MSNTSQEIITVQQQFEQDAKQVASVSESTLLKIIRHNQNTEHGKKHQFSQITSLKQFKTSHPLSTYDRYQKYIQKMLTGAENILSLR